LSDEIISWRVYPHHFWFPPAAWGTNPSPGMALMGLFTDASTVTTDLNSY